MPAHAPRALELIERLGRLIAAEAWERGLNPAQRLTLDYLARANRFSRSPGAVADYLAATKGTVSQTLQALERKGLVSSAPAPGDRRSLVYSVTEAGLRALGGSSPFAAALARGGACEAAQLERLLEGLLHRAIGARGGRAFGLCRGCRHFRPNGWREVPGGPHLCALLQVPLSEVDSTLICREQEPA
jgi:DNA-binding MarR family transcriptional regulator